MLHRSAIPMVVLTLVAGLVLLAFSPVAGRSERASSRDQDASSAAPDVEPASPFPLMAIWDPSDWPDETNLLQPVDPLTLEPLPGYEPIEIESGHAGGFVESAVSPDGALAAFAVHIPGDPMSSMDAGRMALYLVDLLEWTRSSVAEWPVVMGYSFAAKPQFSADGSSIYWIVRAPGSGERKLQRYDVKSEAQTELASLPHDFVPIEHRLSFDERTWYVFGTPVMRTFPTDNGSVQGEFAAGDAELLIIDLDSGTLLESLTLDGVEAGGVPIDELDDDSFPIRNTFTGLDWHLASGHLYVGYFADNWDRGLIVDLAGGSIVDGYKLDAGGAWLDRLADWLVPSAGAVARALSYGFALQLGDGGLVAFSSTREQFTEDRSEIEMGAHAPVWAVDAKTGTQVWQSHLGAIHSIVLSPTNAGQILVHSAERVFRLDAVSDNEGQMLFRLDGGTGDVVKRLEIPGRPAQGKDSMVVTDEFIYIRTITESGSEVIVVDPVELSVAGNWSQSEGEPSLYKLIPLP